MTASSQEVSLEQVRDIIVAAVSQEMGVPVEQVMRSRQRRSERASEARWVAMWVLSIDVDRVGVPELTTLFDTTWQTIDKAWREVEHTPRLVAVANDVISEYQPQLDSLPKVAQGRGEE